MTRLHALVVVATFVVAATLAGLVWFGSHLRTRDRVEVIERTVTKPAPAAVDHSYDIALSREALCQLAIATKVLGAECNPRRKFAPLHLPKGFCPGVEEIEIGGEERPRGFVTGGRK